MFTTKIQISSFVSFQENLANLQDWKTTLAGKNQHTQAIRQAISVAKTNELIKLSQELQIAAQDYDQACEECLDFLRSIHKSFRSVVKKVRKQGVNFSYEPGIDLSNTPAESLSYEHLLDAIHVVSTSLNSFLETIAVYQEAQIEIARNMEKISWYVSGLTKLDVETTELALTLQSLRERNDSEEDSLIVHDEVWHFHEEIKVRYKQELQVKLQAVYEKLLQEAARLSTLDAITQDDDKKIEWFKERYELYNQNSHGDFGEDELSLLDDGSQLAAEFEKRADYERSEIDMNIDALIAQTKCIIDDFSSDIPEKLRLLEIISDRPVDEGVLSDYFSKLERAVEEFSAIGKAVLDDYVSRSRDPSFILTEGEEIDLLGSAIIQVAARSEYYQTGKVWELAEDILLRLILSELSASEFFNRFGYTAITRALEDAIEKDDFVKVLQFLSGEFIPQTSNKSRDERIKELLSNPDIRTLLTRAGEENLLLVNPAHFDELNPGNQETLLMLLLLAGELIPLTISLQWIALLIRSTNLKDELKFAAQQEFLRLLGKAKLYSERYYSLIALGEKNPSLWKNNENIDAIFPVVRMAVEQDADSKQVLFDLCNNPRIIDLIKEDDNHAFMFASLVFYVTIRWNFSETYAEAWAVWDQYEEKIPMIVDVIRKRLQGDDSILDSGLIGEKAKEDQNNLYKELEMELDSRRGNQGVRLAELIHEWYVRKYISPWLGRIGTEQLSLKETEKYRSAILDAIKLRDMVDACPYQDAPPDSNMRKIEGRLKVRLNNRIEKMLEQARTILQLNSSVNQHFELESVDVGKLIQEINSIGQESEIKYWSVKYLLGAHLPKFRESLTENTGGWAK